MLKNKSFGQLRDLIVGAFLLVFSGVYLGMSGSIKTTLNNGIGGSKFMPRVIGVGLLIIGVVLVAANLRKLWRESREEAGEEKASAPAKKKVDKPSVCITFALLLAYTLLLERVGFLICTALYLTAQIWILSPKDTRKLWRVFLIAVVADLVIYLLFTRAFSLVLPMGLIKF